MVAMILMANRGPSAAAWWMTLLIVALFVALFGVAPLLSWMSGLVGQARTRRMVTAATLAGGTAFALATYVLIGNLCPDWVPEWLCLALS